MNCSNCIYSTPERHPLVIHCELLDQPKRRCEPVCDKYRAVCELEAMAAMVKAHRERGK